MWVVKTVDKELEYLELVDGVQTIVPKVRPNPHKVLSHVCVHFFAFQIT